MCNGTIQECEPIQEMCDIKFSVCYYKAALDLGCTWMYNQFINNKEGFKLLTSLRVEGTFCILASGCYSIIYGVHFLLREN